MAQRAHIQLRRCSKGMLQRIGIAQALINDPKLVILDEPMSGLDPIGRKEIRDIIHTLKAEGKTVFFSSHILQDAEMVCDRIAIIHHGKIIRVGLLDALLDDTSQSAEIVADLGEEKLQHIASSAGIGHVSVRHIGHRGVIRLLPADGEGEDEFCNRVNRCVRAVHADGGTLYDVSFKKMHLEDLFLKAIGS